MSQMETITLGGGCFWCVEAAFAVLRGVQSVESGYTGGHVPDPSYREVCSGATGHAEVVQVTFDPAVISLTDILEVFFTVHDPTTLNRQGADVGTQYRSAVFLSSPSQREVVEGVIRRLEADGIWNGKFVTEVEPLGKFYKAEDYHQEYYRLNADKSYCRIVIEPKLDKLRKKHQELLRADA